MSEVDLEQVLKPGYCYGNYNIVFKACKVCLVKDMCEKVTKGDDEVSRSIIDKAEIVEEEKKGQKAAVKVNKSPVPDPEVVPEPEVIPEPEPEVIPEPEPELEPEPSLCEDAESDPEVFKTIDDLFTMSSLRLKENEKVASTEEPANKPYIFMKNVENQKIGYVWKKDDFVLIRVGKTKDHVDVKLTLDGDYGSAMSEVENLLDKA